MLFPLDVESKTQQWTLHASEDPSQEAWHRHAKHILVYTVAGKPVFSRYGNDLELAPFTATLLAITCVVIDNNDVLQHLATQDHTAVFLDKGPLQLCCIAQTGEPPEVLQRQLEFVFHVICSIVPLKTIQDIFDRSSGADFRTTIAGTFPLFKRSISYAGLSAGVLWNALDVCALAPAARAFATDVIQTAVTRVNAEMFAENKDCIILALLLKDGKVIAYGKRAGMEFSAFDLHVLVCAVGGLAKDNVTQLFPVGLSDFNGPRRRAHPQQASRSTSSRSSASTRSRSSSSAPTRCPSAT